MNTGVVSMRYAKALLAYAKAQKVEDRVYEEVKTLAGHYVSLPDLRRAIENPVSTCRVNVICCVRFGRKGCQSGIDALLQSGTR